MNAITPISIADLDLSSSEDPRIKDVRLGERLGMAQPLNIRQTIEANRTELERYGSIHALREMIKAGKGAKRQVTVYYLNEGQVLLLCMFSRTEAAATVRQEVISVFMAWRRGQLPTVQVRPHVRRKPRRPVEEFSPQADLRFGRALVSDGTYLVVIRNQEVIDTEDASGCRLVNVDDQDGLCAFLGEIVSERNLAIALGIVAQRCMVALKPKPSDRPPLSARTRVAGEA